MFTRVKLSIPSWYNIDLKVPAYLVVCVCRYNNPFKVTFISASKDTKRIIKTFWECYTPIDIQLKTTRKWDIPCPRRVICGAKWIFHTTHTLKLISSTKSTQNHNEIKHQCIQLVALNFKCVDFLDIAASHRFFFIHHTRSCWFPARKALRATTRINTSAFSWLLWIARV